MNIEAAILTKIVWDASGACGAGCFRLDLPSGVDLPNGYIGTDTVFAKVEALTETHLSPCIALWSQVKVVDNGPV